MSDILKIDEVDKACINALLDNPRGSWKDLSLVSNVPEKTLSRRIRKLFDKKVIRTVVELNPLIINKGFTVHVWLSVELGRIKNIAKLFSERPEVRVVFLTTGIADIFLEIGLEKPMDLHTWLHSFVTKLAGVKTIKTQVVLKHFFWASRSRITFDSTPETRKHVLSENESHLIEALSQDGRISIKNLSNQIGLSEHKTVRIMTELLEQEVFSIRLDFEPSLLGYDTEAIILIKSKPEAARKVVNELSRLANTRCLFGISGDSQFFWHVLCRDLSELWDLTTEQLSQLEGIQSCNTNMITNAYKRAGYMRKDEGIQLV